MVNLNNLKQLTETVKIKESLDSLNDWNNGNGSQTYFDEMKKEIDEALVEYKKEKQVYLEDELGDVLWDYYQFIDNAPKILFTII